MFFRGLFPFVTIAFRACKCLVKLGFKVFPVVSSRSSIHFSFLPTSFFRPPLRKPCSRRKDALNSPLGSSKKTSTP
ncbi:hypothetical protein DE146DRAFT_669707 [Phaeosphaeria sp. MPI-PUGE-AT-0046c]|nr:hypothetical protein DE146DRAFT_669707 [Phaeosphaeria sp. MPI-PUGE-AT-0046c]